MEITNPKVVPALHPTRNSEGVATGLAGTQRPEVAAKGFCPANAEMRSSKLVQTGGGADRLEGHKIEPEVEKAVQVKAKQEKPPLCERITEGTIYAGLGVTVIGAIFGMASLPFVAPVLCTGGAIFAGGVLFGALTGGKTGIWQLW